MFFVLGNSLFGQHIGDLCLCVYVCVNWSRAQVITSQFLLQVAGPELWFTVLLGQQK